jgi:hypothetical protein
MQANTILSSKTSDSAAAVLNSTRWRPDWLAGHVRFEQPRFGGAFSGQPGMNSTELAYTTRRRRLSYGSGLASGPSKSFLSGSTANDLPFRGCLWASARKWPALSFSRHVAQPLSPFLLAPTLPPLPASQPVASEFFILSQSGRAAGGNMYRIADVLKNRPCGIFVTLRKSFGPVTLVGRFSVRMSL